VINAFNLVSRRVIFQEWYQECNQDFKVLLSHAHPIWPSFDITKDEEKHLRSPLKAHSLRKITKSHFPTLFWLWKERKLKKHFNSFPSKRNIKLQTPRRETQTYNVVIIIMLLFCRAKPACFDFSSSNFNVQGHIRTQHDGWGCCYGTSGVPPRKNPSKMDPKPPPKIMMLLATKLK